MMGLIRWASHYKIRVFARWFRRSSQAMINYIHPSSRSITSFQLRTVIRTINQQKRARWLFTSLYRPLKVATTKRRWQPRQRKLFWSERQLWYTSQRHEWSSITIGTDLCCRRHKLIWTLWTECFFGRPLTRWLHWVTDDFRLIVTKSWGSQCVQVLM